MAGIVFFMGKHTKTSKTFRFSEEELALLDQLKDRHGTYTAGIIAAAKRELGANAPSKQELLAHLERLIPDD